MTSGFSELNESPLTSLDESGAPPKPSRLSSAATLRTLYQDMIVADEGSAIAHVRVQAAKDGAAPFNHAALVASGQGGNANANWLVMQDRINKTNNGYNDMIVSVKQLVTVETELGEASERYRNNRIIATELTRTIRKWSAFTPLFLQVVDTFNTHGVAVSYFADSEDFRFKVCSLRDFQIPRQTPATEEAITYAVARQDMIVTELYERIQNPVEAAKLGWNVEAVKRAINRATTASSMGAIGDQEKMQQQVKNNDLWLNHKFEHVKLLNGWIREFDGSYSFVIVEKEGPDNEFLFTEYSRYENADEAFALFCYGIGNGTYHSIRGLGHMIFPQVQLYDRAMCKVADAGIAGMMTWFQLDDAKALEEVQIQTLGPMGVVTGRGEFVNRHLPDLTNTGMPVINEMRGMIDQSASRFSAPGGETNSYQNRLSSESQLEESSSSDSGAVDLFYMSFDRLFREMCRRIINGPKSDRLVKEFHQRCFKQGVTQEILASVDHASTYAFRSFGAGSPAARMLGFMRLLQLYPNLDPVGQKRLLYQIVASIVGFQNAEYFTQEPEDATYSVEGALATLENFMLAQGNPVPVDGQQLHAIHVQKHIPPLMETLNGVETGQIDPMEVLPGLQASLDHIAAHGEALATDPAQAAIYGQVKEAVNNLQQVVTNMDRKIKAEQRRAVESGAGPDGQPSPDGQAAPDTEARLAELRIAQEQFKLDLAQRIGELKIAEIQAKSQQALALNDVKSAAVFQKELAFPATTQRQQR